MLLFFFFCFLGDKVTMVGFDDGPSISFTSWVIAPTYPRKIVKPGWFNFWITGVLEFSGTKKTLNAIDMK